MKLQIDTKNKTIKVEEKVKFDELIKVLNKLLPKEWKEYSLESGTVINWYQPYQWYYWQPSPLIPSAPIVKWDVTCGTSAETVNNSVYNIEATIN
jgi:hypothetical protein